MKKFVYSVLAVLAATAALAAVENAAAGVPANTGYVPPNPSGYGLGSVIQSWYTPAGVDGRACCETGGYVIVNTFKNPQYVCMPTGSCVSSHDISLGRGWRDSSRCHLGSGYYAIINADPPYLVAFINIQTGSVAGSFPTRYMGPYPMNLTYDPDTGHYYANSYGLPTTAYKYTTTGSEVGTITLGGMGGWCGALGYTKAAKGNAGAYIWMSSFSNPNEAICTTAGSLVATWSTAELNGCGGDCGKSSVNDAWVVWELRSKSLRVYEYDIEGNISVTPRSLGSIKALFK
jgi:hypothetical protein